MCGIAGFFSPGGAAHCSESDIEKMRDTMVTRGPDDAGLHIYNADGCSLGLGHRRLSILDLSSNGRQPMSTEDGRLTIVFNGEIFNFLEIRSDLEKTGAYSFRSRSDTEVILSALAEWGLEECLRRLRGMYAFAVFDKAKQSLTLVRDPLGVKPLYYSLDEKRLLFASEIKAILAAPGFNRQLNPTAVYHYLTFMNAPAPLSFFRGVEKLEPGTYMEIQRDWRIRKVRYWDPSRFRPENDGMDEEECARELRRLLRQAVERRMVSDVPFGVFLSGGVDSSLNVALMAELMERPVETFSIGIAGDPTNEFSHASQIAGHFRTNHHEVTIGDEEFLSFLPKMVHFQDEPLADPVCVPIYYVSKLARDCGTIVVQVGEGSDELFAGYGLYHSFAKWDRDLYSPYKFLPGWMKTLMSRIASPVAPPHLADALRRAAEDEPLFLGNAVAFWDDEKLHLLGTPPGRETSGELIGRISDELGHFDPLTRIIQVELRNRLPELLLMRVDKMTMANSVEARVPFLDEDVVEFALRIPPSLKRKNGVNKYILKRSAEGILPSEVIYRSKWGFCGSATNILSDKLASYCWERLHGSRFAQEMFNRREIEKLFQKHGSQKRFNSSKIWCLLNLVIWHEYWFQNGRDS